MADTRNSYKIAQDHAEHVTKAGHATFKVFQPPVHRPNGEHIGDLFVEVCTECPFIKTQCQHTKNEWNAEGTVLSCVLCGMDGT